MRTAALYMRVSTDDQTVENQRHRMRMYAKLRGWDIVPSYKLSRIGRSLPHFIQMVEKKKKHGVQFVFSDDPSFDTITPHGKLMPVIGP